MQKINYPLIVSDFDGTLVREDGTISEKNKKTIEKYVAAGGKFAISTGRMPDGILNRAAELGLKGMVCCCQGAIILDIETRAISLQGRIPFEKTYAICKKLEDLDVHYHVYDLWEYYSNKDDGFLAYYEKATGSVANRITDKPLSEFVKEKTLQSHKILVMVDAKENDRIMHTLAKENLDGCVLTKSSDILVEVINEKYSKGTAVKFLADYYGVPLEKTVAIGDQWNDLPMIKEAGLGVAVKNADGKLKKTADYVCENTCEEDAVAEIIEKYGFTEN